MLNTVTIEKKKLQKTLEENKKSHVEIFDAAMTTWKVAYKEKVQAHLDSINNSQWEDLKLPEKPISYEGEYDNVLKQLEFSVDKNIVLTGHEFEQYILDKWQWNHRFYSLSNTYVSSSHQGLTTVSATKLRSWEQ